MKGSPSCRNQRSGVADSNPPHKVCDREAPRNRNVHSPDAHALDQQVTDRDQQHHQECERNRKADQPSRVAVPAQDDGANLVGDRSVGMVGPDQWRVRRGLSRASKTLWHVGVTNALAAMALNDKRHDLMANARYARGFFALSTRLQLFDVIEAGATTDTYFSRMTCDADCLRNSGSGVSTGASSRSCMVFPPPPRCLFCPEVV